MYFLLGQYTKEIKDERQWFQSFSLVTRSAAAVYPQTVLHFLQMNFKSLIFFVELPESNITF